MSNTNKIQEAIRLAIQQAQDIIDGGESAKDALQDQLEQLEEEGTFYAADVTDLSDALVGVSDLEESLDTLEGFGTLEPTYEEEEEKIYRSNATTWSGRQYREVWLVRRLLTQAAIVAGSGRSQTYKADAMRSLAARICATAESRRQDYEPTAPTLLDWAGDKAYMSNLTDRRWLCDKEALEAADWFMLDSVHKNKRAEKVEDLGEISAYYILGLDATCGI